MPPFPGPREMLCCTRYPVKTFTWPLSILVGRETSRMRLGVRRIWRKPGSSFRNSAAISNCICAMRKGFRSSRGAMRGTIGGALIFVGVVGFATVAMGVGPFLLSYSLVRPTWPRCEIFGPFLPSLKGSSLAVCSKLFGTNNIRIAATDGTKMQQSIVLTHGNRERFIDVHAADRVAHQAARGLCRLCGSRPLRGVLGR